MRFSGKVIWVVFGGALVALLWLLGAAIFALSVVGLPLARTAMEMAGLSLLPFGKEVVHVRLLGDETPASPTALARAIAHLANLLWLMTFGLVICLACLALGVACCLTIAGIPWGRRWFRLAGLSLWPVGWRVVSTDLATVGRQQAAVERFARYRQHGKRRRAVPAPPEAGQANRS